MKKIMLVWAVLCAGYLQASLLDSFFEQATQELRHASSGQTFERFITRKINFNEAEGLVKGTGSCDRRTFFVTDNGSPEKPVVPTTNYLSFALYVGKYDFLKEVFSKKDLDERALFPVHEQFQSYAPRMATMGYESFFYQLATPFQRCSPKAYHHEKHMELIQLVGEGFLEQLKGLSFPDTKRALEWMLAGKRKMFRGIIWNDGEFFCQEEKERKESLLLYFSYFMPDLYGQETLSSRVTGPFLRVGLSFLAGKTTEELKALVEKGAEEIYSEFIKSTFLVFNPEIACSLKQECFEALKEAHPECEESLRGVTYWPEGETEEALNLQKRVVLHGLYRFLELNMR